MAMIRQPVIVIAFLAIEAAIITFALALGVAYAH
jgi:hypothetical protein